jgi:uncharacterized membrane protein
MIRIEKSIVIGVPLDKVYTFCMDWRNLARYFEYIREVKPITEKTIGQGARLALKIKFLGRMTDVEWAGAEHIEKVGWTFTGTFMGRKAVKRWHFAPVDDSTRVTFTLEYKPRPLIGQIMYALLVRSQFGGMCERSFQNLKRLIEAETATAAKSV